MKTQYLKPLGILVLTLLSFNPSSAQNYDSIAIKEMKKLSALHGRWSGSGWYQMANQERVEFNQTENIYPKLEGQVLVVNGLGKDPESGNVVFEAFAVMHFSKEESLYKFNTYTNNGGHTTASAKLENDSLTWWFDVPKGTIRYTIHFTQNTWVEDGHFSPDSENWYPFLHMELKKLE